MHFNLTPEDIIYSVECGCCYHGMEHNEGIYYCERCKLKGDSNVTWIDDPDSPPTCKECVPGWLLAQHFGHPQGLVKAIDYECKPITDPEPGVWYPLWVTTYGRLIRTYGAWLASENRWETARPPHVGGGVFLRDTDEWFTKEELTPTTIEPLLEKYRKIMDRDFLH